MPVSPKDVLTDPKFQQFSAEQRQQVLLRIDPAFAKLSPEQQQQVVSFKATPGPSAEGKEQAKKSPFALTTGIEPTAGGVAGYEAKELAGGGWDAIKGIWDLAKPPSSVDELMQQIVSPGSLQAKRMVEGIREPLSHIGEVPGAIRDLKQSGVGMPALALQVPRTMGNLATSYELGRLAQPGYKSLAGKVGKATVETPARVTLQRLSGAGKEPVLMEAIKRKATETERAANFGKAKAEIERSNQERLQEHAQEVSKAQAKYRQELVDYDKATAEKKAEHSSKVLKARKEWVDKAYAAKAAEQEAAKVSARRDTLNRTQEEYGKQLQQNMKQTFQTVKGRLDSRWDHLRKTPIKRGDKLTILNDEPLNSKAIADTVDEAQKKFLQGAPESITQFRNLMNWMREDTGGASASMVDAAGGAEPALRPITWDEARTHYSALGDRMFSGDLPGNVMQAIRYVRDKGLATELRFGATRANALPAYESILQDWSGFESDWKDMSSITRGGGSPLAVALKAPNAATLIPQVTGRTGDLLMERFGRYRDAGASPTMASAIRKLGTEAKNLPKVRVPKTPGPLELPAEPKIGEPPELSTPKAPKLKTAKTPEPVPPIDPVSIRRMKMLQYSGKPKRYYDYLPPNFPAEQFLSVDAIREWVARQPRKELPVR